MTSKPYSPQTEWKVCERCGTSTTRLYEYNYSDEDDYENMTLKICWDCDHDICNGGDPFEDAGIIYLNRRDEAYAYDPINNHPPTLERGSN